MPIYLLSKILNNALMFCMLEKYRSSLTTKNQLVFFGCAVTYANFLSTDSKFISKLFFEFIFYFFFYLFIFRRILKKPKSRKIGFYYKKLFSHFIIQNSCLVNTDSLLHFDDRKNYIFQFN